MQNIKVSVLVLRFSVKVLRILLNCNVNLLNFIYTIHRKPNINPYVSWFLSLKRDSVVSHMRDSKMHGFIKSLTRNFCNVISIFQNQTTVNINFCLV